MVTIVHVGHTPISLYDGTMGRFALTGRGGVGSEKARFTTLEIPDVVREPEDVGGDRRLIHERDGRTVAVALIGPFLDRGVFIAAGAVPTEAELEAAEARYHEYLRQQIEDGMSQWEKYHRPELVDMNAKIGARVFGMSVPWAAPTRASLTIPCEGCGEQIAVRLAWHQACGAILDIERAAALGYLPAIQAQQARAGMPTTVATGKGRQAVA